MSRFFTCRPCEVLGGLRQFGTDGRSGPLAKMEFSRWNSGGLEVLEQGGFGFQFEQIQIEQRRPLETYGQFFGLGLRDRRVRFIAERCRFFGKLTENTGPFFGGSSWWRHAVRCGSW